MEFAQCVAHAANQVQRGPVIQGYARGRRRLKFMATGPAAVVAVVLTTGLVLLMVRAWSRASSGPKSTSVRLNNQEQTKWLGSQAASIICCIERKRLEGRGCRALSDQVIGRHYSKTEKHASKLVEKS